MEYPHIDELHAATKADDLHAVLVRSQSILDKTLQAAIGEALLEPHAVELGRVSFPLKLDFAIALGSVGREMRGSLRALNRLRNDFAHDADADVTERQAREAYEALPQSIRAGLQHRLAGSVRPQYVLRVVFVAAYCVLSDSVDRQRQRKRDREEWLRKVREALAED